MYQPKLTKQQFEIIKESLEFNIQCYNDVEADNIFNLALACLEKHVEGYEPKILGMKPEELIAKFQETLNNLTEEEIADIHKMSARAKRESRMAALLGLAIERAFECGLVTDDEIVAAVGDCSDLGLSEEPSCLFKLDLFQKFLDEETNVDKI